MSDKLQFVAIVYAHIRKSNDKLKFVGQFGGESHVASRK